MVEESAENGDGKLKRGKGRGGNFFALTPQVLEQLFEVPTTNQMNLVLVFMVMLAGTGSDHRLTKWSAKACDEYLGIGVPRAKTGIEELIAAGVVERTEASSRMKPQYRLPELPRDAEPIFLPTQLVTGFAQETPILRRVRECGDALLLRMLIDLYGLVTTDAPQGIPLNNLRGAYNGGARPSGRKLAEIGSHAVWAFEDEIVYSAGGDWTRRHYHKELKWQPFWDRVKTLRQIGAVYDEPWIFDGEAIDAEPLIPLDASGFYQVAKPTREAEVTFRAFETCRALIGYERYYLLEKGYQYLLPLPVHHRPPAFRLVTRLRAEADTPGHRRAYAKRQELIDNLLYGFDQIATDAEAGQFARPPRQRVRMGGV